MCWRKNSLEWIIINQILELKYTQAKEALGPEYSDAEDLATAAKLLVEQRKERIA